jgi:hypothetical protein
MCAFPQFDYQAASNIKGQRVQLNPILFFAPTNPLLLHITALPESQQTPFHPSPHKTNCSPHHHHHLTHTTMSIPTSQSLTPARMSAPPSPQKKQVETPENPDKLQISKQEIAIGP